MVETLVSGYCYQTNVHEILSFTKQWCILRIYLSNYFCSLIYLVWQLEKSVHFVSITFQKGYSMIESYLEFRI
jgi:hypothetical protein